MLCPGLSWHAFIFCRFKFSHTRFLNSFSYLDYNSIDYGTLCSRINQSNIRDIFSENDVNQQVELLNQNISDFLTLVPTKTVNLSKNNGFVSRETRYLKSLRDLAFRAFLHDKSEAKWKVFCKQRNRCKNQMRKLKRQVTGRVFEGKSSKEMWNVLRRNGALETAHSIENVDANSLNEHFLSHQRLNMHAREAFEYPHRIDGFLFRTVTVTEIYDSMMTIKSNSIGYDNIPLKFIKLIFPYICDILLYVVNSILEKSTFPDSWKVARVVPIHKKGASNDFCNLRPISVLPVLSKIVENIIKIQLMQHADEQSLLNDHQSAYRAGHSTTSLLLSLTDSIRSNVCAGNFSILISLDLTKAFDSLDDCILNGKLYNNFNFSTSACRLISSYFEHRKQYVECSGCRSEYLDVITGVPQGSVLGPILFMFYLNDFFEHLSQTDCKIFVFADDIQLLFKGKSDSIVQTELQINDCLLKVQDWMNDNRLTINASKTKAMLFKSQRAQDLSLSLVLNNTNIEFVSSMKCLGVIIDDKLSFEAHVNSICASTNFTLKRLYSLNLYLPIHVKKHIAHSLLLSRILYGLEVYTGTSRSQMTQVKLLFNRVIRFVYNIRLRDHVSEFFQMFFKMSFDYFILLRLLLFFYKTIYSQTPQYLCNLFNFSRSIRNQHIVIPRIFSILYERSFVIRVARAWNQLPRELKCFSVPLNVFKNAITQFLISQPNFNNF